MRADFLEALQASGAPLCRDSYRNDKDELWEEIKIPGDNEDRKLRVRLVAKDTKT